MLFFTSAFIDHWISWCKKSQVHRHSLKDAYSFTTSPLCVSYWVISDRIILHVRLSQRYEIKNSGALIKCISSFHIIVEEVQQNETSSKIPPLSPPSQTYPCMGNTCRGVSLKVLPLKGCQIEIDRFGLMSGYGKILFSASLRFPNPASIPDRP